MGMFKKPKAPNKEATLPKVTDEPKGTFLPNAAVEPKDAIQPNAIVETKSVIQPDEKAMPTGGLDRTQMKSFIPKPLMVDKKLTIIFVENTEEVAKEKNKLEKLVSSIVNTGDILVINYGRIVREGKAVDAKWFDYSELVYEEYAGEDACLYDAIIALEEVVEKNYKATEDNFMKTITTRINSIEIIGIGRCVDKGSITSSEAARQSFWWITRNSDVITKYFCLTEESFVNAAAIGFHSIGAINRKL